MPYIASKERPAIDKKVEALAEEVAGALARGANDDTEVSVHYRHAFVTIGTNLILLEKGKSMGKAPSIADSLALEVFGEKKDRSNDRGAWLGRLNYALTRLIQVVPDKMVERGVWKEVFRYWVYAQTAGALARSAMEIQASGEDGWPTDGVVGVLVDVKDEYKRRVNTAYEMVQIRKAGDCYTVGYRTELSEVKDASGRVVGYSEVMKDMRAKA